MSKAFGAGGGKIMYKNILVPIALDHARDTGRALEVARRLLSEGGVITALKVIEEIPAYVANYLPQGHAAALEEEIQTELKAELGGVADVKAVVMRGHAGQSIVDYAQAHDVDCIVIASHRPGVQDYLIGSTAARVVRHATCAVHVIR